MIELIQFPWSPFCIVQRRILEYSGAPFRIKNVPNTERSLVWQLTGQQYYGVPIIRDGKVVVFESGDDSQDVAKYLDRKLSLSLFPERWEGVQSILWRYIENEVEGLTFKLNDVYYKEFVAVSEHLPFVRHKERKFGRGCIDQWRAQKEQMIEQLAQKLVPFEQMLVDKLFLLDDQPRFVDFDLFGMLGNFLYSGHYKLPAAHPKLKGWYRRMSAIQSEQPAREKLHPRHKRASARSEFTPQL